MFIYQADGNLVLYDHGAPLWSSGTSGTAPGVVHMQEDGNLVLYDGSNVPRWASGTAGYAGAYLLVQDDGNAVMYKDGVIVWATHTAQDTSPRGCVFDTLVLMPGDFLASPNRRFYLLYQPDGNLVLYETGVGAFWASGTAGSSPGRLAMQGDGNLVIYDGSSRAIAATNTAGSPGAQLVVQDDGNVVIYATDGTAVWATHTIRR